MGRRSDQQEGVQSTHIQGLKSDVWRGTTAVNDRLLCSLMEPITPARGLTKQLMQQVLNSRRATDMFSPAVLDLLYKLFCHLCHKGGIRGEWWGGEWWGRRLEAVFASVI